MKQAGCTKVAVANDKEAYGAGLASLLELEKADYGVTIVSNTGIDPKAPNFRSYAATVKGQGADCFFFAGIVSNGAVQITKDVNAALPDAKIFGGDGVCTSSYTNEKDGGVPASIDPLIQCTVATSEPGSAYPGGKAFLAAYKAKYGDASPDPYAIIWVRGDEARARHDQEPGQERQQPGRRGQGAVRDQEPSLGPGHLRVRQERRHDAQVVRPLQGRFGLGDPVFLKTLTPTNTVL